jgi:hypothetical protein
MMRWLLVGVGSVAYWLAAIGVMGLLVFFMGNCGAGTTDAELASCVREQRIVAWVWLALALAAYVATLWGLARKRR